MNKELMKEKFYAEVKHPRTGKNVSYENIGIEQLNKLEKNQDVQRSMTMDLYDRLYKTKSNPESKKSKNYIDYAIDNLIKINQHENPFYKDEFNGRILQRAIILIKKSKNPNNIIIEVLRAPSFERGKETEIKKEEKEKFLEKLYHSVYPIQVFDYFLIENLPEKNNPESKNYNIIKVKQDMLAIQDETGIREIIPAGTILRKTGGADVGPVYFEYKGKLYGQVKDKMERYTDYEQDPYIGSKQQKIDYAEMFKDKRNPASFNKIKNKFLNKMAYDNMRKDFVSKVKTEKDLYNWIGEQFNTQDISNALTYINKRNPLKGNFSGLARAFQLAVDKYYTTGKRADYKQAVLIQAKFVRKFKNNPSYYRDVIKKLAAIYKNVKPGEKKK